MKKIILMSLIASSAIFAEEVKLEKSIINPDYIEVEKLKSTKNVIVLNKQDIDQKGYSSISQVLNDVPGITVGTSSWGEIDIRGQGTQAAKNIQVMVDGAPITTLVNHPYSTNYDIVPVEQIEKIEIIPGGGSVLYGNGTSGGVINITTNLKAMNKPINKAGYEFTIDQEKKYYANAGTKINENLIVQLNYSKSEKDWYFTDTYNNSQYFSGGFNYKISDKQNISFQYSRLDEDGQFVRSVTKRNLKKYGRDYKPREMSYTVGIDKDGFLIKEKRRSYLSSDREQDNFKTNYNLQINENLMLTIDGFKSKGFFTNNDDEGTKMYQDTVGTKAKLNISYGERNSLLIGADYFKQKASLHYSDYRIKRDENGEIVTNNGKATYYEKKLSFDYERLVKALYFMNIYKIDKFEFTQGMRYDITDWSFNKAAADGSGNETRISKNKNYELSLGYNYSDTGKIYARYERGFTGPDGLEVSDRVLDKDGNKVYRKTEAEDEIFNIYEIGLRDYILGSAISLNGFLTETDNQMDRVYINGITNSVTVNYLKTKRYGMEFTANQSIGKFSFEEGYTYLKGKSGYNNKGKAAVAANKKIDWSDSGLQKVPKHMISLKTDYSITDNLKIGGAWRYTGKYNNFYSESRREEDDVVKSHTVVDFSIGYNNPNGISVYGGINNLFNETYYGYTSAGKWGVVIPEFGRTFYAGFSYTF